ncbi:glycosyltransferase family 2 protein [Flavobacterium lacus]|uniref:Glycosyltransferase involved in cell wall biosynthesis n=1 Tax=Flavobacterium lacus TaxID=1353778 RepID=A0A328WNA7_9FLAO|nr:glycosyltransferase family 2 protein [Flavobacterium lacus]RAR46616.1 glycosyltransferase involved in cell wall biosynthesis [Flavobacterium lacus]
MKQLLQNRKVAIVIPYYNASEKITYVINKIPEFINYVIIVDDCGNQPLPQEIILANINKQTEIFFLKNQSNLGVGGATKLGFKKAIDLNVDIVIKVDADNQMDLSYLPYLIEPIISKQADYVKGNRFRDFKALKKMPVIRRIGNLVLSFLIKISTGYWNVFDPTNGYFAVKVTDLKQLDFSKLSNRYFFETSLIAELYYLDSRIMDLTMPAVYNDEKSSMKVWQMPIIFSWNLLKLFIKRILKKYFLFDFNIGSLYILAGLPLFLFGIIYGIHNWIYYSNLKVLTPTGTIMLVTLSIILGFQLLLQAIQYDIINSPKLNRNE